MYTHITKQHGSKGVDLKVRLRVLRTQSRNIARQDDDDDDGATLRRSSDISALKVGLLCMLKPTDCAPAKCTRGRYMHGPIVLCVLCLSIRATCAHIVGRSSTSNVLFPITDFSSPFKK